MSQMKISPVLAPPYFPAEGRLPDSFDQVQANANLQIREEKEYKLRLNAQNGLNNTPPCCKSLHISLFFDGTNNNEKANTEAEPPHPSNIARLYHAALDDIESGYYRYYMPGVGTAFPEIGELDFSNEGLKYAKGGEPRINWALLRIVDSVKHTLTGERLDDSEAKRLVISLDRDPWTKILAGTTDTADTTSALIDMTKQSGKAERQKMFGDLFAPLRVKAKTHQPKILKIKLFIYGFSRGAAEARAFVNWLTEILDAELLKEKTLQPTLLGWPIAIEFLGLCDTVASVGIARVAPGFRGHMAWADDNLALPDEARYPNFIRHCYHFVSAHEQRLCFPLDSVRRKEGNYPLETREVIYPGVHSDVGGGYTRGEQGKGVEDALILSQIVLHDLYAAAFAVGAPLSVPEQVIPPNLLSRKPSRKMEVKAMREFDIEQQLIERFNIWRTTLRADLPQTQEPGYEPVSLDQTLESMVEQQMAWMTAWRIGRFANGSYQQQPFYQAAEWNSGDAGPGKREASENKRNDEQKKREDARRTVPDTPGVPIFEPALDQQQLLQGANEFRADYESLLPFMVGMTRENTGGFQQIVLEGGLGRLAYIYDPDDQAAEYKKMKKAGDSLTGKLFKDKYGTATDDKNYAQICALYDDHIHDSRAWFMHSTLGFREMWAGYFRYRTIYSGDYSNKGASLLTIERRRGEVFVGVAIFAAYQGNKAIAAVGQPVGAFVKEGMELSAQARQLEAEITAARNQQILEGIKSGVGTIKEGIKNSMELSEQARQLEIEITAARNEKLREMGRSLIRGVAGITQSMPPMETCQVSDTDGRAVCLVPAYDYMAYPMFDMAPLRDIYNQHVAESDKKQMDDLVNSLNNPAEVSQ
ncbi:putative alpha/beta hydrolase family protein DUF2235 [Enterobacter sp. BIGb0383]|uniref:T6SS phospholipase effector Tle1-like catalytic domain-containing protein n=1 Tax=unclassified Enterobacter TaxID=2608935 RepID=UPI000F49BA67|nr:MULTISPECIES: DUF2235 domain-containing protein [unclassified Enterobacter]ROP61538.1 putative alpha/beta hydrolase family protein DUF2235 [Enterobacter sp. BIGb0383]ROS11699.1 putative alpha/beta hydrolase family protein DUF2235 [Enterobacter sp. BIGb0359]